MQGDGNDKMPIYYGLISKCSKLIAIKLCALSEKHAKVRRESVAGYAMDETLVCGSRAHKMVAKIYMAPARSIVSVDFEQLLIGWLPTATWHEG